MLTVPGPVRLCRSKRPEKNGLGDGANRRGTRVTGLQVGVGLLARLEQRETGHPIAVSLDPCSRSHPARSRVTPGFAPSDNRPDRQWFEHSVSAKNKPHDVHNLTAQLGPSWPGTCTSAMNDRFHYVQLYELKRCLSIAAGPHCEKKSKRVPQSFAVPAGPRSVARQLPAGETMAYNEVAANGEMVVRGCPRRAQRRLCRHGAWADRVGCGGCELSG